MPKYWVYIKLVEVYDAADEDEAFEMAMNDIAPRDGMEIMKHEIVEDEK